MAARGPRQLSEVDHGLASRYSSHRLTLSSAPRTSESRIKASCIVSAVRWGTLPAVRKLPALLALGAAFSLAASAPATIPIPVEFYLQGPGTVRLIVAHGAYMPCDASENRRLIDGKFGPGQVLRTTFDGQCVCYQQTYEPFVDSDWSVPRTACIPCRGKRGEACPPGADMTIRVAISSEQR